MKPITNILLIGALVCYVFLPFCTVALSGNMTGLSLSAELITQNFSFTRTLMALLPFVALFGGIAFNCLRSRYWGLASGACIIAALVFFIMAGGEMSASTLPMTHDPELAPADVHEGYEIEGKAIGYYLSYGLTWVALVSCIVSMMPFKFNIRLEQQIDGTLERQLHRGKEQWNRMEQELHLTGKKRQAAQRQQPAAAPQPEAAEPAKKQENPLDYLPADQRPASPEPQQPAPPEQEPPATPAGDDHSRFMPH